jgi:hypothetical protein
VINPGTDAVVQTSSTTTTPPRHIQWYGFGRQEQVYCRVTGTTSTTGDYTATLETADAPIVEGGTFLAGSITISPPPGVTTDTDFWVYDENFNAIPDYGNDDPGTLTRSFAPGTYYLAYTNFNLANNQPAASGETFLTGAVMDFADVAANSSTTTFASLPVRFADALGPVDVAAAKSAAFEVIWVRFTVSSTPPVTGACCLPDGTCVATTAASCATQQGAYRGDNVACGTVTCPQPGACCFSATFTCEVLGQTQCTAAGGVFLGENTVCGSCPPPPAGSVAILAATSATDINDVRSKLLSAGIPEAVIVNVTTATPTLQFLQQFGSVLVWTNLSFQNGAAMGDLLADYVDAGGGVVTAVFVNTTTTANRFLGGRWNTDYQIIPHMLGTTTSTGGAQSLGTIVVPGHPILSGVNTFSGGTSSTRPTTTTLTPHGVLVAQWTDGKTLVAVSNTQARRVDLGMYPPSNTVNSTGWVATTDGAQLMANALRYAQRSLCYPNCDGSTGAPVLNVNDFICFQARFAAADPYADCDQNSMLNVNDFICFQGSFAAGCR